MVMLICSVEFRGKMIFLFINFMFCFTKNFKYIQGTI